jgi:hypothetical protein
MTSCPEKLPAFIRECPADFSKIPPRLLTL